MSDELLSDEDLAAAEAEADKILAEPAKAYAYLGEYKGGPRNLDPDAEIAAALELTTARLVVEEIEKRLLIAQAQLYTVCQDQQEQGVPIATIARYSGLEHRGSVYRAIRRLPSMLRQLEGE